MNTNSHEDINMNIDSYEDMFLKSIVSMVEITCKRRDQKKR